MVDGLNLYCISKIDKKEIIKMIGVEDSEILFIDNVEGWINKKNEKIVIEFIGVLDDEDDYPGYYCYEVSLFVENIKEIFKKINDKNIIVDFD
ncbi:hypothetical protein [uncultured Clostridium sp.]|uniref:hypothetical protein n=2 Tax=uncultured Clostridium sp. TaxID=59620 RepID=UPI00261613A5|nr:hypothetical protein [uncultured Clostridium sp.]